jgi:hypothetical protein
VDACVQEVLWCDANAHVDLMYLSGTQAGQRGPPCDRGWTDVDVGWFRLTEGPKDRSGEPLASANFEIPNSGGVGRRNGPAAGCKLRINTH